MHPGLMTLPPHPGPSPFSSIVFSPTKFPILLIPSWCLPDRGPELTQVVQRIVQEHRQ